MSTNSPYLTSRRSSMSRATISPVPRGEAPASGLSTTDERRVWQQGNVLTSLRLLAYHPMRTTLAMPISPNNFDRFITNLERLNLLTTGNVPIHYRSYSTTVGWALVDEIFLPAVNAIGPWYLADVREPACPRVNFHLPGYGKKVFPLNRLIATIVMFMRAEPTAIVPQFTREQAWLKSQELITAQIRFRTRNPYDCTIANLLIGYQVSEAPFENMNKPELEPKVITDPVDSDFESWFAGGSREPLLGNTSEIIAPKGSEFVNELDDLLGKPSTDNSPLIHQAKDLL